MKEYSKKNPNANVEYHYPVKQCIQYQGGKVNATAGGNVGKDGATAGSAKDLVDSYNEKKPGTSPQYTAQQAHGQKNAGDHLDSASQYDATTGLTNVPEPPPKPKKKK